MTRQQEKTSLIKMLYGEAIERWINVVGAKLENQPFPAPGLYLADQVGYNASAVVESCLLKLAREIQTAKVDWSAYEQEYLRVRRESSGEKAMYLTPSSLSAITTIVEWLKANTGVNVMFGKYYNKKLVIVFALNYGSQA